MAVPSAVAEPVDLGKLIGRAMIEWVLLVIIACSVVQSVFGMGLLVFGTPSLLLLGFEFAEVLGYLLPASISISAIQVFADGRAAILISRNLWVYCVPMIGAGLALSLFAAGELSIDRIVGGVLVLSVAGVVVAPMRAFQLSMVRRYSAHYHAVMGIVHGLSNMGGSLLSVYAATRGGNKSETRYLVAYYYFVFSTWQVIVLLATGQLDFSYNLATPVISVPVYLLLGNRVFRYASEPVFKALFTAFMAAYGAALLIG